MSDIISDTEQGVFEDAGVKFSVLTVYDRAELLKQDRAARRQRLSENLAVSGLEPAQRFVELQRFDDEDLTESDWIRLVNDPRFDHAIHLASLKVTCGEKAEELSRKLRPDLIRKAKICGLSVGEPTDKPDPNAPTGAAPTEAGPPAGSTYSTPAAGK
jgi:hypothetical protein